jgi:phosphoribosylanthranilate isomerase
MNTYDFCQVEQTQHLWKNISSHWQHCNRPDGQRFLGSVQISPKATEEVIDVVGDNLRKLGKFTYRNLLERFEPEQNWLRVLTFALSEYAYYHSKGEEKFWNGFCTRLKLPCGRKQENTLRGIAEEGFKLLGLVQAKGGYRYVSTLWLQSGIPKENIKHFSQLVEVFSQEYGWWEIAHASSEDISQLVFAFCEDKYPQLGTLINFLKASCPQQDEEVEPISGQLIQGIATIAVELERQGKLPDELINDHEREKVLGGFYLPNNFFLRNWDNIIRVLKPEQVCQRSNLRIVGLRPKPLSLVLDNDSLNM